MLIVAIRTIIIYIVVLFAIRVMGKSELSKLSPFQMVITFMIAELATIPIESSAIPIMTGITAIASLVFLQVFISYISIKSEKFKNFINGTPSILIDNGAINTRELSALRITINDLLEQLRLANASSITDVDYAIMESNGNLSVIQKSQKKSGNQTPQKAAPTKKAVKTKNSQPVEETDVSASETAVSNACTAMPCVVFSDGIVYYNNLKKLGYTKEAFEKYLKEKKLSTSKIIDKKEKIFLIFCDENKSFHIYRENKPGFATDITNN